jgi:hypothetical protein
MGWLVRRVVVMWVILSAICAGVVGIVRANGGQDRLQAMGFGVCDGEPCFRGIKVGVSWNEAERLSQDAIQIGPPMVFILSDINEGLEVVIHPSEDGKTAEWITLTAYSPTAGMQLSAAELVLHFGYPCGVHVLVDDNGIRGIVLIYPQIQARVYAEAQGLSLHSPFRSIDIWNGSNQLDFCKVKTNQEVDGPWRGFTSVDMYLARNRRDLDQSRR